MKNDLNKCENSLMHWFFISVSSAMRFNVMVAVNMRVLNAKKMKGQRLDLPTAEYENGKPLISIKLYTGKILTKYVCFYQRIPLTFIHFIMMNNRRLYCDSGVSGIIDI